MRIRKQYVKLKQIAQNEASEYDRQKTEFFSNMIHELKTPLSVILSAVQLIEKNSSSNLDAQVKYHRQFKVIRQNCYRLLHLINNTLDITKIDSGYTKSNMTDCNIVYLAEEITQSIMPFAEQKGVYLEFDTEFEEIITCVDIDKIEKVILNLLSNAIKFTQSGGKVWVHVNQREDKAVISVKDTGIGIPMSMQDEIFKRFHQVGSQLSSAFEGSGIGLSLVKSFVELHNGKIKLISEEKRGSEFIIELPISFYASNSTCKLHEGGFQEKISEAINIEFSGISNLTSNEPQHKGKLP